MIYDELVRQLKAISGVRFAEYAWKTRPAGDFGTVQLDFETEGDDGDDLKQDRAWEGSVDLYTVGEKPLITAAVESALESVCESCWELNSIQYEPETGFWHYEWVWSVTA